ncbi:hypothetical protein GCM10010129_68850 [Streptomyces fumigatiscleroticus]|nr:hypothetical protein GCM10010129_68850 [Streptomyces fumigatiscleroticus]
MDSLPHLAAEALMKLVDSEDPPLRLLLGSLAYDTAFDISRKRMDTWAAWEDVSRAAEQAAEAPRRVRLLRAAHPVARALAARPGPRRSGGPGRPARGIRTAIRRPEPAG